MAKFHLIHTTYSYEALYDFAEYLIENDILDVKDYVSSVKIRLVSLTASNVPFGLSPVLASEMDKLITRRVSLLQRGSIPSKAVPYTLAYLNSLSTKGKTILSAWILTGLRAQSLYGIKTDDVKTEGLQQLLYIHDIKYNPTALQDESLFVAKVPEHYHIPINFFPVKNYCEGFILSERYSKHSARRTLCLAVYKELLAGAHITRVKAKFPKRILKTINQVLGWSELSTTFFIYTKDFDSYVHYIFPDVSPIIKLILLAI